MFRNADRNALCSRTFDWLSDKESLHGLEFLKPKNWWFFTQQKMMSYLILNRENLTTTVRCNATAEMELAENTECKSLLLSFLNETISSSPIPSMLCSLQYFPRWNSVTTWLQVSTDPRGHAVIHHLTENSLYATLLQNQWEEAALWIL